MERISFLQSASGVFAVCLNLDFLLFVLLLLLPSSARCGTPFHFLALFIVNVIAIAVTTQTAGGSILLRCLRLSSAGELLQREIDRRSFMP